LPGGFAMRLQAAGPRWELDPDLFPPPGARAWGSPGKTRSQNCVAGRRGVIYGQPPAACLPQQHGHRRGWELQPASISYGNYGTPALYLKKWDPVHAGAVYPASLNPGPARVMASFPPLVLGWILTEAVRRAHHFGERRVQRSLISVEVLVNRRRSRAISMKQPECLNAATHRRGGSEYQQPPPSVRCLTSPMTSAVRRCRAFSTARVSGLPAHCPPWPKASGHFRNSLPSPSIRSPLAGALSIERALPNQASPSACLVRPLRATGLHYLDRRTATRHGRVINNVFNRDVNKTISGSSQPFALRIGLDYQVPKLGPNRWTRAATAAGSSARFCATGAGSPFPFPRPTIPSVSVLFQSTFATGCRSCPLCSPKTSTVIATTPNRPLS